MRGANSGNVTIKRRRRFLQRPSTYRAMRSSRRLACACAALLLIATGCGNGGLVPPQTLDLEGLVKVDRTAENEISRDMVSLLKQNGSDESIAAIYEYDILPYKPIFFLGAGRGLSGDRQELMTSALPMFGGEAGPGAPPEDLSKEGMRFLCAPFNTTGVLGTSQPGGLASMSAVCVWDGKTSGFAIGVAGRSVDEVLGWTAEARRAIEG